MKKHPFNERVWGPDTTDELNDYQEWLSKHPHCGSPRPPGVDGPKPNQVPDETNPKLYYIDYSMDGPKQHNMYTKPLGKLGRFKDVSELYEAQELQRKEHKKRLNMKLPWETLPVEEFLESYHVKGGNVITESYDVIDHSNDRPPAPESILLKDEWPAVSNLTHAKSLKKKISPWIPPSNPTRFTKDGTFLESFEKKEMLRKLEKYLHVYKKTLREEKQLHAKKSVKASLVDESDIHEAVSQNISDGLIALKKRMDDKNYWYYKLKSIEKAIDSVATLDLHEACFRGNVVQVRLLLAAGRSPTNHSNDGDPLFNQCFEKALALDLQTNSLQAHTNESKPRQDLQKILQLLYKAGADVNALSESNRVAPIHRAAVTGNVKMLTWLLSRRGDLDLKSKKDLLTTAQYAARQGQVYVLGEIIRERGMKPLLDTDPRGRNCLHFAALYGQTSTCVFLLNMGLDKRVVDKDHLTAGKLAEGAGYKKTAILVQGFSVEDTQVSYVLQYITDERNLLLNDQDQFKGNDGDEDDEVYSISSALFNMRTGATSSLQHAMSYLYKSLYMASEKI
jgi:ankyrin repeat protein